MRYWKNSTRNRAVLCSILVVAVGGTVNTLHQKGITYWGWILLFPAYVRRGNMEVLRCILCRQICGSRLEKISLILYLIFLPPLVIANSEAKMKISCDTL